MVICPTPGSILYVTTGQVNVNRLQGTPMEKIMRKHAIFHVELSKQNGIGKVIYHWDLLLFPWWFNYFWLHYIGISYGWGSISDIFWWRCTQYIFHESFWRKHIFKLRQFGAFCKYVSNYTVTFKDVLPPWTRRRLDKWTSIYVTWKHM